MGEQCVTPSLRLEVHDLRFGYDPDRLVLDGVDVCYEAPGILCILGSNGTGKSTLLRCITGELAALPGSVITLNGQDVSSIRPMQRARLFAYLAQTHVPAFSYPVIDVVSMGRTSHIGYLASPTEHDIDCAYEQLEYLGIAHLAQRPYTAVSGGERQLVMLASALAQEPQVLILDEPTQHLDFGNQYRFIQLVQRLRARGIGVLMTTHFPDHALLLDSPTAVLAHGRIQAMGPATEVITGQSMQKLYGIDVGVRQIEKRTVCIPGLHTDDAPDVTAASTASTSAQAAVKAAAANVAAAGAAQVGAAQASTSGPVRTQRSLAYWSGRAAEYSQLHEDEMASTRGRQMELLVERLVRLPHQSRPPAATPEPEQAQAQKPVHEQLRALDLGCGSAFMGILLAKAGCAVTGIDFSQDMLAEARSNAEAHGVGQQIHFVQGDVHTLPFEAASFDLVITRNVTWVLDNVDSVYREVLRVLRPGGLFINIDANYGAAFVEADAKGQTPTHPTQTLEQLLLRNSLVAQTAITWTQRPAWDIACLRAAGASRVDCVADLQAMLDSLEPEPEKAHGAQAADLPFDNGSAYFSASQDSKAQMFMLVAYV